MKKIQDRNGDGDGGEEGSEGERERGWRRARKSKMGSWMRVETRGRTNDANEDGSGDKHECSSEDENGDEDRNRDGNEDRAGWRGEDAQEVTQEM